MTGPERYAQAERLMAVADRQNRGVTYGQEWTLTLTAAQSMPCSRLLPPPRSALHRP
jgi:hypothetical protein